MMNSTFVFDAHVHVYPKHDCLALFRAALRNLPKIYPLAGLFASSKRDPISAPKLTLCLAERNDCHFFRDLHLKQYIPEDPEIKVEALATDAPGVRLYFPGGGELLIVPGRQIISQEKVEILSFTAEIDLPDNTLSAMEVFKNIWAAGGIPAINWAPGKWWFSRGKIIKKIIHDETARPLLICDTTLRPDVYPEPILMRAARRGGIKLIAGSDPLPTKGEERRVGMYGTIAHGEYNHGDPVVSLRNLVLDSKVPFEIAGARPSLVDVATRMTKYYRYR